MSTAAAGAARSDGVDLRVDPGDGVEAMTGPGDVLASPEATGFTMLGTPGAAVCDEDGICEVPSSGTSLMNTDVAADGV